MPYGGFNGEQIGNIAFELTDNIDLIREETPVSELKSYNKIQKVLKEADRLYILGFGFDDYNIKVLNFPNSIKNIKEVFITTKGLVKNRSDIIFERIFKYQDIMHFEPESCEKLLKEHFLDKQT